MNIKNISKILIISLILANLGGCENTNKNSLNYNAPYYSITITSYEKLINEYLDVDISIPKIVYTGPSTKSNLFVNTLNKQIENDVTNLVKNAKQTAKDNHSKNKDMTPFGDMANRPFVASDSNTNNRRGMMPFDNMPKRPFISSNSNIDDFPSERPFGNGFNRKNRASNSNANRNRGEKPFDNNKVTGFTNSDELIIPGLHNKNIIVVETTTKEVTETSANTMGDGRKSRIVPSENSFTPNENGDFANFKDRGEFPSDFNGGNRERFPNDFNSGNREGFPSNFNNGNRVDKRASSSNIKKPANDKKTKQGEIIGQDHNANKEEENDAIGIKNNDHDVSNNTPNTMQFTSKNRTTITCDYIVFCLDNDYISFNISINTYGENSETKNLFYNIDLKNEKTLTIKDMIDEKNKEVDDNANFFINSNHAPVIVNNDKSLTIIAVDK